MPNDPQQQNYQPPNPELASGWKPENVAPKHEQDKMAHELKEHSKEHPEKKISADETKTIKIEKHITTTHENEVKYSVAAKYKMDDEALHDGLAESPGGAILSLTLGIILSFIINYYISYFSPF